MILRTRLGSRIERELRERGMDKAADIVVELDSENKPMMSRATLVVFIDRETLQVKRGDIFSENATSLSTTYGMYAADMLSVTAEDFQAAGDLLYRSMEHYAPGLCARLGVNWEPRS